VSGAVLRRRRLLTKSSIPRSSWARGGIDYVYADNDDRQLYVARGNAVLVFDLDTLKLSGSITNARARGEAVDPKNAPRLLHEQTGHDVGHEDARNDQDD
jgi:ABC-type uncharacterized transport system permease subunit